MKLEQAIHLLLSHAEMVPIGSTWGNLERGNYQPLCFLRTYHLDDDPNLYELAVKIEAWTDFLNGLASLYEGKVSKDSISSLLSKEIKDKPGWEIPDQELTEVIQRIVEEAELMYSTSQEIILPIFRLASTDLSVKSLRLGSTTLHFGGGDTPFAKALQHDSVQSMKDRLPDLMDKHPFLKILASGDKHNIEKMVINEARNALIVFRFVTPWMRRTSDRNKLHHPASMVSIWPISDSFLLWQEQESGEIDRLSTIHDSSLMVFQEGHLEIAYHLGLEDLNYHFENRNQSISQRIVRALSVYDVGVLTPDLWQAMYSYVICINMVFPGSKDNDSENVIRTRIETLIKFGGYVGAISEQDGTWTEKAATLAQPFKKFYEYRSRIIHGDDRILPNINEENVNDVRGLAHNVIRLTAEIARKKEWFDDSQFIAWLKNPN